MSARNLDPYAPLTDDEWAAANSPEAIAAESYGRGYADGLLEGMLTAKAECLREHATLANAIDAAARRFYLLEASDAPSTAVRG